MDGEGDAPLHLDVQVVDRLLGIVCRLKEHLQHDDISPPKHFSILYTRAKEVTQNIPDNTMTPGKFSGDA